MSKLILTQLDDKDCQPSVLAGLLAAFKVQTGKFPMSVVFTEEQAKGHFIANGEVMSNFQGIPLEIEAKTDETRVILKTINGFLSAMHTARIHEVTDVYSMLENMKVKLTGETK